jgi:hypothetical protein
VATGLAAAGYEYGLFIYLIFLISSISAILLLLYIVNLDDCWQRSRDAQGIIQADPTDFPSGIPALTDYIHSKKLKFGLYSGISIPIRRLCIFEKTVIIFCCIHQMQDLRLVLAVLVHCTMKQ